MYLCLQLFPYPSYDICTYATQHFILFFLLFRWLHKNLHDFHLSSHWTYGVDLENFKQRLLKPIKIWKQKMWRWTMICFFFISIVFTSIYYRSFFFLFLRRRVLKILISSKYLQSHSIFLFLIFLWVSTEQAKQKKFNDFFSKIDVIEIKTFTQSKIRSLRKISIESIVYKHTNEEPEHLNIY